MRLLLLAAVGCNRAPLWPDESYAPEGNAPWSHPTDEGCETMADPAAVEVDGFLYCGVEQAFGAIHPVDDPVYSPCTTAERDPTDPVMSVFDGVRARAYRVDALDGREIVHTDWDGEDVLVAYCPLIAGGDVFHREIDGVSRRFHVAGLWGSANTVTPRDELATGDHTVYTAWDGHALLGPGRPGSIEKFGALIDYLTLDAFVDRYGGLGETCEVWFGQEELGVGCAEACAHREALCGADETCGRVCAEHPRWTSECMLLADTCDAVRRC